MTLTIGVLSMGSPKTLHNTLTSYRLYGLDQLADQKIIWFNEISDEDKRIADEFGYQFNGSQNNLGIAGGYKMLVAEATSDLFLFLENDWVLIEEAETQIVTGAVLLQSRAVDVVRYRHREIPGDPLWSRQFRGNETSRPEYLLESMHWESNPEKFSIPTSTGQFHPIRKLPYGWYMTDARFAAWTNNPTMFRTEWIRSLSNDFEGDVEVALQAKWISGGFGYQVAQGNGLFTHYRVDR